MVLGIRRLFAHMPALYTAPCFSKRYNAALRREDALYADMQRGATASAAASRSTRAMSTRRGVGGRRGGSSPEGRRSNAAHDQREASSPHVHAVGEGDRRRMRRARALHSADARALREAQMRLDGWAANGSFGGASASSSPSSMALSPSFGEEKGPTTEAVSKYDLMSAIRLGSSCLDLVCDLMTTLSVATAGEVKADAEEVRYRTVCCHTAAQPHVHYEPH